MDKKKGDSEIHIFQIGNYHFQEFSGSKFGQTFEDGEIFVPALALLIHHERMHSNRTYRLKEARLVARWLLVRIFMDEMNEDSLGKRCHFHLYTPAP